MARKLGIVGVPSGSKEATHWDWLTGDWVERLMIAMAANSVYLRTHHCHHVCRWFVAFNPREHIKLTHHPVGLWVYASKWKHLSRTRLPEGGDENVWWHLCVVAMVRMCQIGTRRNTIVTIHEPWIVEPAIWLRPSSTAGRC